MSAVGTVAGLFVAALVLRLLLLPQVAVPLRAVWVELRRRGRHRGPHGWMHEWQVR